MATTYHSHFKPIVQLQEKDIKRFCSKIDKTPGHGPKGDCWIWTSRCSKKGYGLFQYVHRQNWYSAHRLSYFMHYDIDPGELGTLHHCDNPPCVNPSHLFLGTNADNTADCVRKGRQAKGEKLRLAVLPFIKRGNESSARRHPERLKHGEQHYQAKVTAQQVKEIRSRYIAGRITHRALSLEYGVTHQVIGQMINRKTWKHVQ